MSANVTIQIDNQTRQGEDGVPIFELRVSCSGSTGGIDSRIFLMLVGEQIELDEFERVCTLPDLFEYDNNRHDAIIQEDSHYRISNFVKEYTDLDTAIQAGRAVKDLVNQLLLDYNQSSTEFSGTTTEVINGSDQTLLEDLTDLYETAKTNLSTAQEEEAEAQTALQESKDKAEEQQSRITQLESSKTDITTSVEGLLQTDIDNFTTTEGYSLTAPELVSVQGYKSTAISNKNNIETNSLSSLTNLIEQEQDLLDSSYDDMETATAELTAATAKVTVAQAEVDKTLDAVLQLDPTFVG